ncbi:hypothetical protein C8Q70DRAFT_875096, partial [Cubamyces menziesii]
LEPLAIAANVTQASDTHLNHVLFTLRQLYRTFKSFSGLNAAVQECILESLEMCLGQADQNVFILAVFFNPYVHSHCFNQKALSPLDLVAITQWIYKRIFRVDTDTQFLWGLLAYLNSNNEFSADQMLLDDFYADAEQRDERIDIKEIWSLLDVSKEIAPAGHAGIARLAIRILSIVGNSGNCKHVFSEFGTMHTNRQSRLSPVKVHQSMEVKM